MSDTSKLAQVRSKARAQFFSVVATMDYWLLLLNLLVNKTVGIAN